MTTNSLHRYLSVRARGLEVPGDQLSNLIDGAIDLGLADFWHASEWSFRRRAENLTISGQTERYELPRDCAKVISVREKASGPGTLLRYMAPEEFFRSFPDTTYYSATYPDKYTIVEDDNRQYIIFYPVPSVSTLYLEILTNTPNSIEEVPDIALPGVIACIEKYLATPEMRSHLDSLARTKIKEMEARDTFYGGLESKMLDAGDRPPPPWRPWT